MYFDEMQETEPLDIPTGEQAREREVARLIEAASRGDAGAFDALYARVYDELHALAHRVRRGRSGDTMSTTALVHEAYLKLLPSARLGWEGRAHFLGVAARAMRQVLVAAARTRGASKRGGGELAVTLDEASHAAPRRAESVVALDEALERLAALNQRQARVVEFRFFAGLTVDEAALVLGVSTPTVERDWRAARAWLAREMQSPLTT